MAILGTIIAAGFSLFCVCKVLIPWLWPEDDGERQIKIPQEISNLDVNASLAAEDDATEG